MALPERERAAMMPTLKSEHDMDLAEAREVIARLRRAMTHLDRLAANSIAPWGPGYGRAARILERAYRGEDADLDGLV